MSTINNPRNAKATGLLLILLGILCNEWFLKLWSPDGILNDSTRIVIALMELLSITVGLLLWFRKDFKVFATPPDVEFRQ